MSQPTLLLSPQFQGVPAQGGTLDVLVRLQAPDQPLEDIVYEPKRLALVVDRSGSMSGQPLREALRCAMHIARHLPSRDLVSLVLYDDRVQVFAPLAAPAALVAMQSAVDLIDSGGSTDLFGGWEAGAIQLESGSSQGISRVILLSDGQANHGLTRIDDIISHVKTWAAKGVTTTTVGLGRGFNEELMIAMAQAGGGQQYYGQTAVDLYDSFDEELSLLEAMYLRNISVKFVPAAGVLVEPISLVSQNPNGTYRLSDLAWGAETWMAVRLHISPGQVETRNLFAAVATGASLDGVELAVSSAVLQLPVLDQESFLVLPADELVSRRLDEVAFARVSADLTEALRRGDMKKAQELLEQMAARFGKHPWLRAKLSVLKRLAEEDTEMMLKESSYSHMKLGKNLASKHESLYMSDETNSAMPAFLRKKAEEGRGKGR